MYSPSILLPEQQQQVEVRDEHHHHHDVMMKDDDDVDDDDVEELPTEAQLVLLCLDHLRDLRRCFSKQELLDAEGLDADYLSVAIYALSRCFVQPSELSFQSSQGNDAKLDRGIANRLSPGLFPVQDPQSSKNFISIPNLNSINQEIFYSKNPATLDDHADDNDADFTEAQFESSMPHQPTTPRLRPYDWHTYDDGHPSNVHRFYPLDGLASGGEQPTTSWGAGQEQQGGAGPLTLGQVVVAGLAGLGARSRSAAETDVRTSPLFDQFVHAVEAKGFFRLEAELEKPRQSPEEERERLVQASQIQEERLQKVMGKVRTKLASKAQEQLDNRIGDIPPLYDDYYIMTASDRLHARRMTHIEQANRNRAAAAVATASSNNGGASAAQQQPSYRRTYSPKPSLSLETNKRRMLPSSASSSPRTRTASSSLSPTPQPLTTRQSPTVASPSVVEVREFQSETSPSMELVIATNNHSSPATTTSPTTSHTTHPRSTSSTSSSQQQQRNKVRSPPPPPPLQQQQQETRDVTPRSTRTARSLASTRSLGSLATTSVVQDNGPRSPQQQQQQHHQEKSPPIVTTTRDTPRSTRSLASTRSLGSLASSTPNHHRRHLRQDNPADVEEAERLKGVGNTHMQRKEYVDAAEAYTAALTISPNGPFTHVYYSNRAAALLSMKRFDEAIVDSERSLALKPDYGKAHARLGLAHFLLGNYPVAVEAYTVSLKYEPDNKSTKNYLEKAARRAAAQQQQQQDDPTAAGGAASSENVTTAQNTSTGFSFVTELDRAEAAAAAASSSKQSRSNSGIPMPEGETDERRQQQMREREAEKLKLKGNSCMANRDYEAALQNYTAAVKLSPDGPNSHVYYSNRAAALCYLERYEEAEADSEHSLLLVPDYGKAHARLGLSRFFMGDYARAIDAYTAALTYDPDNAASKSYLAKAKARLAKQNDSQYHHSSSKSSRSAAAKKSDEEQAAAAAAAATSTKVPSSSHVLTKEGSKDSFDEIMNATLTPKTAEI